MTDPKPAREVVRMYPNKNLREPVREYQPTLFDLVKATFSRRGTVKTKKSKNGG